jgi:antitoxin ParD1/3/4
MNVSLTPQLEKWIQEKVRSGMYQSSSELIREALRLLYEHEQYREIGILEMRQKLAAGFKSLEDGNVRILDESLISEIKQSGRKRLRGDG